MHGVLAAERVAEAVEVVEEVAAAERQPERPHQRRDEKAAHPTVEPVATLACGDVGTVGRGRGPIVVALAECVLEGRVRDWVEQAGDHAAVIGAHVGVVECHRLGATRCQEVAEAVPDVRALAGLLGSEPMGRQLSVDGGQARAVVPEDAMVLGQTVEEATCPVEVVRIGLVEADHHLVEVGDAGDLVDHGSEGGPVHFGGQTGDGERHGPLGRPRREFGLEVVGRPVAEVVERGDDTVLEEVGHGLRLGAPSRCPVVLGDGQGRWPDVRLLGVCLYAWY